MLDELVSTLLYEGYALYPYTPTATKNATPTPFGIVYPPAYATECEGAHDFARLECVADCGEAFHATIRWLTAGGEEQRVELGPVAPGEMAGAERPGARFMLRADGEPGVVRCCVHNTAQVPSGLDRAEALEHSLLSLQILLRVERGRFVSPLESGRDSVNTWPVLASERDDVILGAPIVLPDHPQVAPRSHGNLFDNTEIEEALVLHVHTLTDRERAAVSDPKVREMLERTLALTPREILDLHGGLREIGTSRERGDVVPVEEHRAGADGERAGAGSQAPRDVGGWPAGVEGEEAVTVAGVTYVKGAKLLLRPDTERSVHDRILNGRRATLERIYVDYEDRVHLAVTVDDDPGQELLRETGRYLFFFPNEVEPL